MRTKLFFILAAALALTACSPGTYYPFGGGPDVAVQTQAQPGQPAPQAVPAKRLGELEPDKSPIIPS